MSNKINKNEENNITATQKRVPVLPPILVGSINPIKYSLDVFMVDTNTHESITGESASCDTTHVIQCNISKTPGAKFKTIKRVLLKLKNKGGLVDGFAAYGTAGYGILQSSPSAYVENRYDSSENIAYRIIDITDMIKNSEEDTISVAIKHPSGASCSVYTAGASLEIEYLEDDDFIPNVSKIKKSVGKKGAYSVNTRNGKLFYTQSLIQAKGGRMPLNLSMTYNAADCDTTSPNGMDTGIKGWTFNYGQTIETSSTNYTLLDGAHKYRTFKPSTNNSAIRFDASGKNGAFMTTNSTGYIVSDGKTTTYAFDTSKRLVNISSAGGASPMTTSITYNTEGKINTITDGMTDVYSFVYGSDAITISRANTALVEITLASERVTQVKYLLSGETYLFTYNTDGELLTVTESALDEKTVLEYSDAHAVKVIKNYVYRNSVASPTESFYFEYGILETKVSMCRNTNNKNVYTTMLYVFAENGETVFTSEYDTLGAYKKMRFRTKNDYEKYAADIIDITNATEGAHLGIFTFDSQTSYDCENTSLSGTVEKTSDTLSFDTSNFKSNNYVFSAKMNIAAFSVIEDANTQCAEILLKEGSTTLATLKFDTQRRDYIVKSAMISLPHGVHSLSVEIKINNMCADATVSDVFIFETDRTKTTERINGFGDNAGGAETDNEGTAWYANQGNYTLSSAMLSYPNIKFTTKDYILTTLSRLTSSGSFNIWYNDGANMLAQVGDEWTLTKDGVTKNITEVRCCTVSRGINQKTFSYVEQSPLDGGFVRAKNVIVTYKQEEDENGDTYMDGNYFIKTVDYNTYMKPVQVNNEDGIITRYTYNEFGEVLTENTYPENNSAMNILVSRAYSNGNLASITEKRYETDYTRSFAYNYDDTLSHETTPGGQQINHVYSMDGEKLLCLASVIGESENVNMLAYSGDLLNSLTHNDTAITFEYDERNNVDSVKVCGNSILSKEITYGAFSTESVTTYGNGAKIKKYYDKYNRLIKVTEIAADNTESQICAYIYSDTDVADTVTSPTDSSLKITASSKLYVFIDNVANTRTKYLYDEYGNLKEKQAGDIREKVNSKDEINRPTSTSFVIGTKSIANDIYYENHLSNRIEREVIYCGGTDTSVYYSRDALKRMHSIETKSGGNGYECRFNYATRGETAYPVGTTNYIDRISYYNVVNNVATFEKAENIEYNADGHIVTYGDNTYIYDGLGRLIRENNKALDKTFLFEYNVGGNIVSKTEHAYTTGTVGAATATYNYTYGNSWKDQLTSFGGQSIVYDASGNPTSYLGAALTWSKGRLLTRYVNGDDTVTMQYDANGIRRIKTSPGGLGITKTTEYVYDSEARLRAERIGNMDRYYIYSANGIEGYEEGGVTYTYRKNLFGDITAIYKGTTKMAEYVYDAWGNCTITLDKKSCGTGNPFRYRGYYWDNDLQMYYLLTRYYDPQIGRFINADSIEYLEPNTINGLNLYAYCRNNPVMYVDPYGHEALSATAAIWLFYGILMVLFGGTYLYLRLTTDNTSPPPTENTPAPSTDNTQTNPSQEQQKAPDKFIMTQDMLVEALQSGFKFALKSGGSINTGYAASGVPGFNSDFYLGGGAAGLGLDDLICSKFFDENGFNGDFFD